MDTSQTLIIVAVLVVAVIIALAAWLYHRRRESQRLRRRFGPEYDRAVSSLGSASKAEAELAKREERVRKFHIQPLTPADAAHYGHAWKVLQGRFVDNPREVVLQAGHLVRELMLKRGYPMTDFDRCAADLSVDHPTVVENYRAAQAIATRDERDTEQLRKAVVHYRALFDELLEVSPVNEGVVSPRRPMEVSS
jgi:hypothetical protein